MLCWPIGQVLVTAVTEGSASAVTLTCTTPVPQVTNYEGPHIQYRIALTDGAMALQDRVQAHFPTFTLVLDFIHAHEKLRSAANALFGESAPQRIPWVETQT
jgi:hypothetical protein